VAKSSGDGCGNADFLACDDRSIFADTAADIHTHVRTAYSLVPGAASASAVDKVELA